MWPWRRFHGVPRVTTGCRQSRRGAKLTFPGAPSKGKWRSWARRYAYRHYTYVTSPSSYVQFGVSLDLGSIHVSTEHRHVGTQMNLARKSPGSAALLAVGAATTASTSICAPHTSALFPFLCIYTSRSGTLGTRYQQIAPIRISASTMGCSTATPAFVAIRPVTEGKMAAPAWAKTKMKPERL